MAESMHEGHEMRTLTEEEHLKLSADTTTVSAFKQDKLEKEAQKSWDLFYKRNKTNFFKDRHWTTREFEELCKREVWQLLMLRRKSVRLFLQHTCWDFCTWQCQIGLLEYFFSENENCRYSNKLADE